MGMNLLTFKNFTVNEEGNDSFKFVREDMGPWQDWSTETYLSLHEFFKTK